MKLNNSEIDYNKLVCTHTNAKVYNFTIFRRLENLDRSLHFGDIAIERAESRQDEMELMLSELSRCNPRKDTKIKEKEKVFENASDFFLKDKRLLLHLGMVFLSYLNFRIKNSQKNKNKLIKSLIKKN